MEHVGPGVRTMSPDPGPQPAPEDTRDVALAAAGDRAAFERLYRRHAGRVHGLASRMLSAAEAPEVTQDVFVRTWQKLETFRGEAQFGTWLHRLAINVILSRRAGLAKQRERFLPDDAALELLPVRPVRSELRMDFETSIAQLPEGARAIFVMHDVEGYTHEEIAASMGITTGTTKAQLHRARMLLRRTLEAGL